MTIKIIVKNEKQNGHSSGKILTLEDLLITIGSAGTATVLLSEPEIAPEQAVIVNENGEPLFINQAKGTILNGQELEQGPRHSLATGDELRIGSYNLIFEVSGERESREPASGDDPAGGGAPPASDPPGDDFIARNFAAETGKLEVTSFADILSSLRKEEDQYYFQVTDYDGARRRLPVENEEIVLGWNHRDNLFISDQQDAVNLPQATIRKDWSGVTIYPQGNEAILLNDALLEAGTRLRNNDRLVFSRRLVEAATQSVTLVFCEPAALVELNAILPQELLSTALETVQTGEITIDPGMAQELELAERGETSAVRAEAPGRVRNSLFFGYFTLTEIIIMIVAIFLTSALTYILLELS